MHRRQLLRHVLLLLAVTLLPIVLFGSVVAFQQNSRERHAAETRLREAAFAAAGAVDREVWRELSVLATLAGSDALDRKDIDGFRRDVRYVLDHVQPWSSIALADADGVLVDERVPGEAAGATFPTLDSIRSALLDNAAGVAVCPSCGGAANAVRLAAPVPRKGIPLQVIAAVIPAEIYRAVLMRHISDGVPRQLLLDPDRRIIACVDETGRCSVIEGRLTDQAMLAGLNMPDGAVFSGAVGDQGFVMAHAAASVCGWVIVSQMPESVMSRFVDEARSAVIAGEAAAALLALVVGGVLLHTLMRRYDAERRASALEAEHEAEHRLATAARSLPGLLFRHTRWPDGRIRFRCLAESNNVFRVPILEGDNDSSAGERLLASMVPETAGRWTAELERTAATLDPMQMEGELIDQNQRLHRFRANATVHSRADGVLVWDGVILDITDLHEAERARRLTAERLAFALEGAGAGIWEWDIDLDRWVWSDSLWTLLGYSGPQGEPCLEKIERMMHPDDVRPLRDGIGRLIADGGDFAIEHRLLRPDGSVHWISSRARATVNDCGRVRNVVGLDIDITRLKRFQEELLLAKEEAERANADKSHFLAAASHDLRQPVQSLMLFAHVLSQQLAEHPAAAAVATMQQALDVLKGLLDGILDLSRLDAGVIDPHFEDIEVSSLLQRIETEYRPRFEEKKLKLRVRAGKDWIVADATLIGRIVGNLVENALKYTESGGVLLGARRRGKGVAIEVWDTGVGIPPTRFDAIFDEFVQLDNPERDRAQGLGLGLAIVRRLAQLLGYPLSVRSRLGLGSVFSVTLPRLETPARSRGEASAAERKRAKKPTLILIIEDEAIIREGLRAMLEDWGYAVATAPDPVAALAMIDAEAITPAVILADYHLDHGLSGVDAIKAVRSYRGVAIPAVLLTGDTTVDLCATEDAGGITVAHKPVAPKYLCRLMADLAETATY